MSYPEYSHPEFRTGTESETETIKLVLSSEAKKYLSVDLADEITIPKATIEILENEQNDRYKEKLRFQMRMWNRELKQGQISFGPEFNINDERTNQQTQVKLLRPKDFDKKISTHLNYIAMDLEQNIIGYKRDTFFQGDKSYSVISNIEVGSQGRGKAAGAIEIVRNLAIQELANETGYEMDCTVANPNLSRLNKLEADYVKDPTEINLARLYLKTMEQLRWQVLYGPNGRLGLDEDGQRTYKPKGKPDNLFTAYDYISINRKTASLDNIVIEKSPLDPENRFNHESESRKKFLELLHYNSINNS